MNIENVLTFRAIDPHDDSNAIGVRKPVSTTSRNPGVALDKLKLGGRAVEGGPDEERHDEGHQRGAKGHPADRRVAAPVGVADEQERQRPDQRHEP
jgi:hypothetical protein